ncbi:unnamed protein product [Phyllotreta striolata]|uniref:PX domain-containing protein n=1 Tax=Phyllotreta striolata TaxID=444603 RepID=A0A9N9XK04_PHYSR|nr:unnamed protein product [Phyllotreta striolata]
MTQIMGSEKKGLIFEILSAKISDKPEEKKYVIYTLQIRYISTTDDLNPSIIDRRYTHFLDLYTSLRKEHPNLMNNVTFPKKVLTGNFDNELISARSTGFESLLKFISNESRLRTSYALLSFLQGAELEQAKEFYRNKEPALAYPILENIFTLLNKVYTDRSPAVLLTLIRLVACAEATPTNPDLLKWADLAIHRYNGVSDSDLLELYIPLLQTCTKLWSQNGRDSSDIQNRLASLQKQGMKMNETASIMDVVDSVEKNIFGLSAS